MLPLATPTGFFTGPSIGLPVPTPPPSRPDLLERPCWICSLEKVSAFAPMACRYRQSGLEHETPLRNALQYLLVPNDALMSLPSYSRASTASMHLCAAPGSAYVT